MTEKPRRGNARAEERGVRRSTVRCCKTYNSLVRLPGSATRRAATDPLCGKELCIADASAGTFLAKF